MSVSINTEVAGGAGTGGSGAGTSDGSTTWEDVTTTTYLMTAADFAGKTKNFTNAAGCLVTIPAALGLATGAISTWRQAAGAGQVTFQGDGASSTVAAIGIASGSAIKSSGEGSMGNLVVEGADAFRVVGQAGGEQFTLLIQVTTDLTTAITSGTGKYTFPMPFAAEDISLSATIITAPTGANFIMDVNGPSGTLMTTNKLVIEAGETSTSTAATQPAMTTTTLALGDLVTVDFDQVGSSVAGAGVFLRITGRAV